MSQSFASAPSPFPTVSSDPSFPLQASDALSGVTEQPLVELGIGKPWLSLSVINRLIRTQGVAPALMRAWVEDELVRAIPLTPERERELEVRWLAEQGIEGQEQLDAWLRRQRLCRADVLQLATEAERLDRFRRHRWAEEVAVHFLRRKPELDQAVYSLLRLSDGALAQELHQRLLEGEASFAELAGTHSEGNERHSQGRIGPMPIVSAHAEISSRLRVSRPGQLWPPFQADRYWVLIRLEEQWPARLDEATYDRMLMELYDGWVQERMQLLLHDQPLPGLPPLPSATEPLPSMPR